MSLILYYFFLLLPIFIFILIFLSQPRIERFSLISFSTFFLVFCYVLIPLVGDFKQLKSQNLHYSAVVGLAFMCIGLGLFLGTKHPRFRLKRLDFFSVKSERMFLVLMLSFSFFSMSIYIREMGGFNQAIANGVKLRYGGETVDVGDFAFFLHFIALAKLTGAVSFYRLIGGESKPFYLSIFALSTFVVGVFALINASRGSVVMYLILLVFLFINKELSKRGETSTALIKIGVLFLFLLPIIFVAVVYGKQIIASASLFFDSGQYEFRFADHEHRRSNALVRFYDEGSHVSESLDYVIENEIQFTYFKHFANSVFGLIPYRLTGIKKPETISVVNSLNLDQDSKGSRPPGMFASLWYGGGIFGALLGTILFGIVLAVLQKTGSDAFVKNKLVRPYFLYLYFVIVFFAFNGDPQILLKQHLYLFVFFLFWFGSTYRIKFRSV